MAVSNESTDKKYRRQIIKKKRIVKKTDSILLLKTGYLNVMNYCLYFIAMHPKHDRQARLTHKKQLNRYEGFSLLVVCIPCKFKNFKTGVMLTSKIKIQIY